MNRFLLLGTAAVVAAFATGTALGLAFGATGSTTRGAVLPSDPPTAGTIDLPDLYTGCQSQPVPRGTSVACGTSLQGVDQVLVVRWPDAATMQADFDRTQGGKPDGKCGSYRGTPASGISSTWDGGKPLACYLNANGAAVVLWEVPDKALELLAVRTDGDTRKAFAWWTEAVKTPL